MRINWSKAGARVGVYMFSAFGSETQRESGN
jgi:hypothetical protein